MKQTQQFQLLTGLTILSFSLLHSGNALAGATFLPLRAEDQTMCLSAGTVAQTIEMTFGSNLVALPFAGTTTYDFYSPPLTGSVSLAAGQKCSSTVYMGNTSLSDANDFTVTSDLRFFDYNPATGTDRLIIELTDISPAGVKHDQQIKWSQPTESLPSDVSLATGHILHLALTIQLVSGNPGSFGQLLYNGVKASTTVALFPANSSMVWPFAALAATPNAILTLPLAAVTAGSTANVASVSNTPGASYFWTVNNGNITAGQGTSQITWSAGLIGPVMISVVVRAGECSSTGSATVAINPNTTTTVSSAVDPAAFGQPVPFTANVAIVGGGTNMPTGTVQFFCNGDPVGGPVTVSSGSATSVSINSLPVGTNIITAVYSGDNNCSSSTGTLEGQTVNAATPALTLSSSDNPVATGSEVTFTATLAPLSQGASLPTGTVQFLIDGLPLGAPVSVNEIGRAHV